MYAKEKMVFFAFLVVLFLVVTLNWSKKPFYSEQSQMNIGETKVNEFKPRV